VWETKGDNLRCLFTDRHFVAALETPTLFQGLAAASRVHRPLTLRHM